MIRRLALIALIFYALPCSAAKLQITEAWIKNLPMVVPMRAGYMDIFNNQARTVNIVWLKSEAFARIEIHRSVEKEGMMSMHPVSVLAISSGETVRLAPGGFHLMMMNPLKKLAPGEYCIVTIGYDDQSTQNIEMIVKK
jgi:copper(I)-binding protein